MISRSTIDKVFEAARVEEVIGDFVQLKKSGSNYKGLSPFSDERTPSFMVSPVKQIWKDFSSGKGGNVVAFVMEHEHFSYPEAIKYLAKKYGIEVEETVVNDEQKKLASEKESLYIVSDFAKDYFHKTLLNAEEGKAIGLTYFKERGFTQSTIEKFQLGYSPNSWDAFTQEALKQGHKLEFLEKTGLTIVKEDTSTGSAVKTFDRFKGRVIFPILSMSGRTLGFGGRILTQDKKAAKYLNSPESEIYHKSKVLYGIYHAKQAIAKEDNCYLVEGYTDVIQLYQKGIQNVVSSSGTALTPEQIRLIRRLTQNITLLYDGDAAGLRASLRGVDLILEQGLNVKICTFPEGEDPDSFAKSNSLEELTLYLEQNAQDFIAFKASVLVNESKSDPIKKAETIREIVNSIAKIPDTIKQEIYIKECSKIMDISEEVLFNSIAQISAKQRKELSRSNKNQEQKPFEVVEKTQPLKKIDIQYELELKVLEILLLYGDELIEIEDLLVKVNDEGETVYVPHKTEIKVFEKVYLDLHEDETEFANSLFQELYSLIIENYRRENPLTTEAFIAQLDMEKSKIITDIFMEEEKYQLHKWERKDIYVKNKKQTASQFLFQTILNLRKVLISKRVGSLANDIKENETEEARMELLHQIQSYKELEVVLSRKLDTVIRSVN